MAHSQKDFTADKLGKMGMSSAKPTSSKPADDADAATDDFGMTAAGPSNSSVKFARGGEVEGEASKPRMDRAARRSGQPEGVEMKRSDGGRVERAKGGRVKGKTTINIIVGGDKGQQPQPMPVPVPAIPPPRPPMMPTPGVPPGMPPVAPAAPAGMLPPGAMPPPGMMGRKDGGRVYKAEAGGGSGEGRLAKARAAKGGMAP